jgi:hypothetical protein
VPYRKALKIESASVGELSLRTQNTREVSKCLTDNASVACFPPGEQGFLKVRAGFGIVSLQLRPHAHPMKCPGDISLVFNTPRGIQVLSKELASGVIVLLQERYLPRTSERVDNPKPVLALATDG